MKDLVVQEIIEQKIYLLRGQKVMLDKDLAVLYCVTTKSLNQAVKRNKKRFPEDFAFKLTREENNSLRSQIVTLTEKNNSLRSQNAILTENNGSLKSQNVTSKEKKYAIYLPYAFTEQGVAMLSSVLNSDRAIQINIPILSPISYLKNFFQMMI